MKYIIMCGGIYEKWKTPRQMSVVKGEEIVARTIRLLRENGVEDIYISTDNPLFDKYGVPLLRHENSWYASLEGDKGDWYDAFYPTNEPVCYLFGDVFFSEKAVKTIVETETDDIEFFASTEDYAPNYIKNHVEPFALKVFDTDHLREALRKTRELDRQGKFWRKPIMWELWTVIKGLPLQTKPDEYDYSSYVAINDITCDVDGEQDIEKLNKMEE